jgi:hypothetical protein
MKHMISGYLSIVLGLAALVIGALSLIGHGMDNLLSLFHKARPL